jgi:uncharacterized protein
MHFATSGVEVFPLVPVLVAFAVSLFTSMGGVSGAFLLLPFQMSVLGFTSPAVSATNQLFNVVAIPSGVLRYIREGRMVWPLTWVVVVGHPARRAGGRGGAGPPAARPDRVQGLRGGGAGVDRRPPGARPGAPEAGGAAAAEARFRELVRRFGGDHAGGEPPVRVREFTLRRVSYEFYGETFAFPTAGVFAPQPRGGRRRRIYGIGGGAIIAPFFVAVLGLPVYTVAGAALMGTFVTSVAGVAFYQAIAPFHPSWRSPRTGRSACCSVSAAPPACTAARGSRSTSPRRPSSGCWRR